VRRIENKGLLTQLQETVQTFVYFSAALGDY
jgi:hypothetical protein